MADDEILPEAFAARVCTAEGCGRTEHALGLCKSDYMRHRRQLNKSTGGLIDVGAWARALSEQTDHEAADPLSDEVGGRCCIWRGAVDRGGYGRVSVGPATRLAHRVALQIDLNAVLLESIPADLRGELAVIDPSIYVHHLCHQPACVRVDHLHLMIDGDHTREHVTGGLHPAARLTEDDVRAIRRLHVRGTGVHNRGNTADLAARFGVSKAAIRDVVARRSWAHLA